MPNDLITKFPHIFLNTQLHTYTFYLHLTSYFLLQTGELSG